VSFYETDNQACTGRVTFCYLVHRLRELSSVTLEWIASACVPKLYSLNRIVRIPLPANCNRNRFDSF